MPSNNSNDQEGASPGDVFEKAARKHVIEQRSQRENDISRNKRRKLLSPTRLNSGGSNLQHLDSKPSSIRGDRTLDLNTTNFDLSSIEATTVEQSTLGKTTSARIDQTPLLNQHFNNNSYQVDVSNEILRIQQAKSDEILRLLVSARGATGQQVGSPANQDQAVMPYATNSSLSQAGSPILSGGTAAQFGTDQNRVASLLRFSSSLPQIPPQLDANTLSSAAAALMSNTEARQLLPGASSSSHSLNGVTSVDTNRLQLWENYLRGSVAPTGQVLQHRSPYLTGAPLGSFVAPSLGFPLSHQNNPMLMYRASSLTNPLAALQHRPQGQDGRGMESNSPSTCLIDSRVFSTRDADGIPKELPTILALPEDQTKLSSHQVFLRHQIEAFRASEEDISTHTRGRNKPVTLGQIGIRCRHCSHLPVGKRQKGSTYFPATVLGLYQAAQNMSTTHMQCGLCSEMPDEIKHQFAHLISTKINSSGAGRPYWERAAKKLGFIDTENGIRFIRDQGDLEVMASHDSAKSKESK